MKIVGIILFVLVSWCGQAQVTFQKTYGSHYFEKASRIIQGYDSSYIVTGSSGFTYGSSDVYVLKVDSLGNYLWSKHYGGQNQEHGTDLVETPDSGLAICGYTNSYGNGGYDAYLIKLDKNGDLEWETTFGGSDWDFANALILMPDSGFTLIGETFSFGVGNGDVYLIRTDKHGNVMWENTFGTAGHDVGKDIRLTGFLNNYVSVSTTDGRGKGMDDIWVVRHEIDGDTLFSNTIGDTLDDDVSEMGLIVNEYNIVGTAGVGRKGGSDILQARLDGSLDTVYTKHFGGPGDERGTGMAIRPPVDQMIVGDIHIPAVSTHNYLAYYTSYLGLFLNSYTAGGVEEEHCTSVAYTYDDAFILCGNTESYGVGATDIYLIKMGPAPTLITSSTIDSQFEDFTDVEEELDQNSIQVYPNPARDLIQIDGLDHGNYTLKFVDVNGKLIQQRSYNGGIIDLEEIPNGYYTLEITNDKQQSVFKKLVVY